MHTVDQDTTDFIADPAVLTDRSTLTSGRLAFLRLHPAYLHGDSAHTATELLLLAKLRVHRMEVFLGENIIA